MKINIRRGGNKKQGFSILFFFQFAKYQRRRVRKPINNKKRALELDVNIVHISYSHF